MMEYRQAQTDVQITAMDQQARPTEFVDHLRDTNPGYQGFEQQLIHNITSGYPINPQNIHMVLIAGETGSGKTTLAQHAAESLKKSEEIQRWQKDNRKKLRFYHAAIGRTQNIMMRAGKITAPRGRIPGSQYNENSEVMAQMSALGLHHLDGPAVFFDDSIWDTAIFNTRGDIIGEQRGSLRWARFVMTRLRGQLVILETEERVKQEEVARRAKLREAPADQAPSILSQYGIVDAQGNPIDIKRSAEQSGTAASIAHTRRTLTRIVHRLIRQQHIIHPDFAELSLNEFRSLMSENPDQWIDLLENRYHPLWANRLCCKGEDSYSLPDRVYTFRNNQYPKPTRRHRYEGSLTKVEDALAAKARKSSVKQFRLAVEDLGITL